MDIIEAAPATAHADESPVIRQRPNQWVQGLMSFCAVVGIGAAITLALDPPLRVHVVRIPVAAPVAQPVVQQPAKAVVVVAPPEVARRPKRPKQLAQAPKASPMLTSKDCEGDILCGLGDLKQ